MTSLVQSFLRGLEHPAPGSHLATQGTAPPSAVAPRQPEAPKTDEDDA